MLRHGGATCVDALMFLRCYYHNDFKEAPLLVGRTFLIKELRRPNEISIGRYISPAQHGKDGVLSHTQNNAQIIKNVPGYFNFWRVS